MKKKTTKNKIVMIQDDGSMRTPVVFSNKMLFNLCCLGLVRIGGEEEDGSFNGRILLDLGNMFFKEGFTDVFIHQSLDSNCFYDINVYFKFKVNDQLSSKHHFDEEEDWFCISILNGKHCGGRYVRFSRCRGEVYYHDQTKKSDYDPKKFCNVGAYNIEHPLTETGFAKMKNDIEITLKHRHDWW